MEDYTGDFYENFLSGNLKTEEPVLNILWVFFGGGKNII